MRDELNSLVGLYYRTGSIRARMGEFLGRTAGRGATAAYVVASDGYSDVAGPIRPSALARYLERGCDIERSLWDTKSLVADIDVDFENFDNPAAAYLEPARTFGITWPAYSAASEILGRDGIKPLDLIGGRGFHLVWRVARASEAFRRLAAVGRVPASLSAKYASCRYPRAGCVNSKLGRAFAGLGMVLEFATHRILQLAIPRTSVPVQVTSIEVGPGATGREIVSIDLSEYGDPLHYRHIRLPFSVYLKPRKLVWMLGEETVRRLLPMFEIPLARMRIEEALRVMRSPEETCALSKDISAEIPDQSDGTLALVDEYCASDLAAFHERLYSMDEEEARRSVAGMAGTLSDMPLCAQWILDHPNDWLLKPAVLQYLARVLTALGWHPRAIAELIRSRYEANPEWGDCWDRHDTAWRALFYTRLFTGLIETHCDQLIDLNCVSHREKGYCNIQPCDGNLVAYRDLLLRRRAQ
jgi:hypothetical protein